MKKYIIISLGFVYLFSFSLKAQEDKVYINKKIEALWKTSAEFKVPESVCFCKKQNAIFVSNINGKPLDKDNNGFSSNSVIGPNGLCIWKGFLLIGTREKIVKVDLLNKTLSDYILNTGSIDGLVCFENNHLIYSDWSGNVYMACLGEETEKLLDTTPLKINAADIGFNYEKKIIYVPTFYDNRVMAYKIKD